MATTRSTTIIAVLKDGCLAMAGDGQVTIGDTVVKHTARKLRRMYDDTVLAGFAGAAADGMTLFERFEEKLNEFSGNLRRSALELAKDWRMDRALRRLDALLMVGDCENLLLISGTGDLIEPDADSRVLSIGSGGDFARAAAIALLEHTDMDAAAIAQEALTIAAEICIFTNDEVVLETVGAIPKTSRDDLPFREPQTHTARVHLFRLHASSPARS